jgi:PAS domain-containing protein
MSALELILARSLVSSLELAALLFDGEQSIVYFNEAAGDLVGARFEETGPMPLSEWQARFGPLSPEGVPVPADELPLTSALREGHPAHARLRVRLGERELELEASGLPLVGPRGYQGALVVLWPPRAPAEGA